MTYTEDKILSDSEFQSLVQQSASDGERLIYSVASTARRAYLNSVVKSWSRSPVDYWDVAEIRLAERPLALLV